MLDGVMLGKVRGRAAGLGLTLCLAAVPLTALTWLAVPGLRGKVMGAAEDQQADDESLAVLDLADQ